MKLQRKPNWKLLAVIVLLGCSALVEEVRLPVPSAVDPWALTLWVVLFYGALGLWLMANRDRLEDRKDRNRIMTWHYRSHLMQGEERNDD